MFNIRKHVADAARSMQLKTVRMVQGDGLPLRNQFCHWNAVQAVETGLAVGVVEVILIYPEDCTVHYVNLMADGSMVDFTLGMSTLTHYYSFVRHVSPKEYPDISDSLMALKHKLHAMTPWHIQKLIKLTGKDYC